MSWRLTYRGRLQEKVSIGNLSAGTVLARELHVLARELHVLARELC